MQALRGQRAKTPTGRCAARVVERGNDADQEQTPPFYYLLSGQEPTIKVNTVFGNVPLGSPLVYQLQDFGRPNTKFHFNRIRSATLPATATPCMSFPDLPFFPNPQAVQLFDTNELRLITNLDFDTSRDFYSIKSQP